MKNGNSGQIIDEVNKSMDGTDPNALGRTTRNPPKPGSPAHNNLNGPNTHGGQK